MEVLWILDEREENMYTCPRRVVENRWMSTHQWLVKHDHPSLFIASKPSFIPCRLANKKKD